jgi:hypothetical protein
MNGPDSLGFDEPRDVFDQKREMQRIDRGRLEVEMLVKAPRRVVLGMDENGADADNVGRGNDAAQSVKFLGPVS